MSRRKKLEADSSVTIFRRQRNGKLSKFYSVKFTLDGKQILKSTGCHEREKAEAWVNNYVQRLRSQDTAAGLAETVRRIKSGGETILLDEAFERFLKAPKRRDPGPKWRGEKKSVWADFLLFLKHHHPRARTLGDVTDKMARAYISQLRTEGRFRKTITYKESRRRRSIEYTTKYTSLSPKTCNEYLTTLKQVFAVLQDDSGLDENPFARIPKQAPSSERRRALSPDELALIGEKADDFIRPLFGIGLYTGLREGDICTLRWDEIDLNDGWIERVMLKTGKTVRIPILPALRGLLLDLPHDDEYVLPIHAAMHISNPAGISYRVKKFLEGDLKLKTTETPKGRTRAVSVLDVHSLRHTFVWLAAKHGVPLPIVQSIVGHVTEEMTRAYADHAADADKKQHLAGLPNYLGLPEPAIKAAEFTAEENLGRVRDVLTTKKNLTASDRKILEIVG